MKAKTFLELSGETAASMEDMFGGDWENYIEEYLEEHPEIEEPRLLK